MRRALWWILVVTFIACNTPTDPATPEYWIARLDDKRDQEMAVQKLAEMKDAKAVEPLIKVLQENDKLKVAAAGALGTIKDKRAIPALMAAVTIDPGTGNDEATKSKIRLTERAVNSLAELDAKEAADLVLEVHKKARDASVKNAVIRAMLAIRDPKFVPVMREWLEQDENMMARKAAVELLGELRDQASIPGLITSLYAERQGVNVYPQAAFALFKIGEPAVAPMIATLQGKNEKVQKIAEEKKFVEGAVTIKALEVIADLGAKDAEDAAIAAWNVKNEDTRPYVHRGVALALARIGTKKGVQHLMKALDEPSGELRQFYTEALNELSDKSALPALLAASKKGPVESAREVSFVAYTRLGDGKDLAAAKAAKVFSEELVRLEAAKECGEGVDCWLKKLKDKNAKVRDRAAYSLGRIGDKKATDALVTAVKDPDPQVRYAVIWALRRLGTKATVAQLKAVVEKGVQTHRGPDDYKKLLVALDR